MSFKSVFDNYLDRRDQSARQEVEFANAVSRARQVATAEDRARTALNLDISAFNTKLPGLARRDALEEAMLPSILKRVGYNDSINEATMQIALRNAKAKEALDRQDFKTFESLTGVRASVIRGKLAFSRDNGETWFLQNGMDTGMDLLNQQAQIAAVQGNLRLAEQLGVPQQQTTTTPAQTSGIPPEWDRPLTVGDFSRFDKIIDPYAKQSIPAQGGLSGYPDRASASQVDARLPSQSGGQSPQNALTKMLADFYSNPNFLEKNQIKNLILEQDPSMTDGMMQFMAKSAYESEKQRIRQAMIDKKNLDDQQKSAQDQLKREEAARLRLEKQKDFEQRVRDRYK